MIITIGDIMSWKKYYVMVDNEIKYTAAELQVFISQYNNVYEELKKKNIKFLVSSYENSMKDRFIIQFVTKETGLNEQENRKSKH